MNSEEKLRRVMQDDWEIHGDAKSLVLLLREELLKYKAEAAKPDDIVPVQEPRIGPIDALLRARDRAEKRRDDESLSLQCRYESAIEAMAFERAAFMVGRLQ